MLFPTNSSSICKGEQLRPPLGLASCTGSHSHQFLFITESWRQSFSQAFLYTFLTSNFRQTHFSNFIFTLYSQYCCTYLASVLESLNILSDRNKLKHFRAFTIQNASLPPTTNDIYFFT